MNSSVALTSSALVAPASITLTDGAFLGYLTLTQASPSATITATQGSIASTSGGINVQSGASTANDGIPDTWKTAHGLAIATNIAAFDSDGDGTTDLQEYLAGTDPRSAASAFKVGTASTDASTQFSLTFPAIAGKLYRISESSDLTTWTPLLPHIFATTTGIQSATLPLGGETKVFVRVEIVP
jgi:hypothetical protein